MKPWASAALAVRRTEYRPAIDKANSLVPHSQHQSFLSTPISMSGSLHTLEAEDHTRPAFTLMTRVWFLVWHSLRFIMKEWTAVWQTLAESKCLRNQTNMLILTRAAKINPTFNFISNFFDNILVPRGKKFKYSDTSVWKVAMFWVYSFLNDCKPNFFELNNILLDFRKHRFF